MKTDLRIVLTGGGSGGHVYPLLAVAESLEKAAAGKGIFLTLQYLGPKDSHVDALERAGVDVRPILAGKLRRYFSFANLLDVPKLFVAFVQALWKLYWIMPDAIFSKGGTGAFPVILAGWFYRIPILLHESDAKPGLNNLLSSFFARRVAVTFEAAARYFNPAKVFVTGNPVRKQLLTNILVKERSKIELGFSPDEPLLLVLCGSQGSRRVNEFVLVNLQDLMKITQILHQTGPGNFKDVSELSRAALLGVPLSRELKNRYKAVAYFEDNLDVALSACDIVLARAGAGTIVEVAAYGKPAILIPLREAANDHQRVNAYEFAKTGAAVVIEESNLLPGIFFGQLNELLRNPDRLQKMAEASRAFFKPDAANQIAQDLLALGG